MENRDVVLVEKIKKVIDTMDEIDEMIKSQPSELQTIDYELSDLYHLIEYYELNENAKINVVDRIHKLRQLRRSLNNEYEIELTYQTHKSKLTGNETRKFFANEIFKTVKKLDNEYKNRVLTEENIQELMGEAEPPKKKRGRPKKEENNDIE
jgi:hypothetical protein